MRELDGILPDEMKNRGAWSGDELVLPYAEALAAIGFATEHRIAVLGLESFEVRKDGFQPVDYTGYDRYIPFAGDWEAYVGSMNAEAEGWIKEHRLGENHGYILSSTSETEFARLPSRLK